MRQARGSILVVAGGAGFLGAHLCDALLAEGWQVVCVDSLLTGRDITIYAAAARRGPSASWTT